MAGFDQIKYVVTEYAPEAIGPYSQGAVATNAALLFTSGQLPIDPISGEMSGDETGAQCEMALQNAIAVVRAAGGDVEGIVKAIIYTTTLSHFDAINTVYEKAFDGHRPARSVVGVAELPRGAKVEIELVAVLSGLPQQSEQLRRD